MPFLILSWKLVSSCAVVGKNQDSYLYLHESFIAFSQEIFIEHLLCAVLSKLRLLLSAPLAVEPTKRQGSYHSYFNPSLKALPL